MKTKTTKTINYIKRDNEKFTEIYTKLLIKLWFSSDTEFCKKFIDEENRDKFRYILWIAKSSQHIKIKHYIKMNDIFREMWYDIEECNLSI